MEPLTDCIVLVKREDGSSVLPPRNAAIYVTMLMEGVPLEAKDGSALDVVASSPGAYCIYRPHSDPGSAPPRILACKVGVGGDMTVEEERIILEKADRKGYCIADVTAHMAPRDYELCG